MKPLRPPILRRGIDYKRIPKSRPWSRYKWRLLLTIRVRTLLRPTCDLDTEYVSLDMMGVLTLRIGYAIDGVTRGLDTRRSMLAAFVHDGLVQLHEMYLLSDRERAHGDLEFLRILLDHKFWKPWAYVRYIAVSAVTRLKRRRRSK